MLNRLKIELKQSVVCAIQRKVVLQNFPPNKLLCIIHLIYSLSETNFY